MKKTVALCASTWGRFFWCFAALAHVLLAQTSSPQSTPFLRFRDAALGYHGPSDDFTNLTELKIGWFGPTNVNDPLHGDVWWAVNFAIEEANSRALQNVVPGSDSLSLPLRLIPRWAVDPWGSGISQLARMIYDQQPLALLGSIDSASTHLAEQVSVKTQVVLVSPIATDKSVTLAGVPWMFACAPSDAAIAQVLVREVLVSLKEAAAKTLEASPNPRLVLIACTDHESRMTVREVVKELSRNGRLPDYRFDVPPGAQNINEQMAAAKQARPAVLLIVAGPEDSARLVRAARMRISPGKEVVSEQSDESAGTSPTRAVARTVWPCQIFGTHAMARTLFIRLAGADAEGVRFPLLFLPDPTDAVAARFVERFARARGYPPDHAAALACDATRLLIEAIRRAGPNRGRIREAIVGLSPWHGVSGGIEFDGTGQNARKTLGMATVHNGIVTPMPAVLPRNVADPARAKP